jgi:hypothetical protein
MGLDSHGKLLNVGACLRMLLRIKDRSSVFEDRVFSGEEVRRLVKIV